MLTPEQARARRQEVATEADFYGSMDGASKFVKGDAVAGILILGINIVGGLLIGVISHDMSLHDAAGRYLLLSVGDALVAQVPALLLSIAAAVLVTRTTERSTLTGQLVQQFATPEAWWPVAGILGLLALVPGMPAMVLLPAAGVAGFVGWRLGRNTTAAPAVSAEAASPPRPADDPSIDWSEVGEAALVNLEIGYGLIPLVDQAADAPLMSRITGVRRQLSKELGFVMPLVRVRDDLGLGPHNYRIAIAGEVMAQGEAWPADLLALEAERVTREIPGRVTRDPAFGLPARWIDPEREQEALAAGYTVVDPSTVIGTHLHKLLRQQAHMLFGQDEMHALIETLGARHPQLAQSIGAKVLPLPVATAVCQMLLEEGVSLREFPRIAAALGQHAARTQDPAELLELIRPAIGGLIVASFASPGAALKLIALSPPLEQLLVAAHRAAPSAPYPFEPGMATRLARAVAEAAEGPLSAGDPVALVSQPGPRRALWRLLHGSGAAIPVLAFTELPDSRTVDVVAVVGDGISDTVSA
jgi:flagellar biosynthesis protein FlhA